MLNSSLNAAIIKLSSFAAVWMPAVADANFAAAEQFAVCQGCQDCKEKTSRCSLERGKLGKGLTMFLLIILLGWAMLVFAVVLPLLNQSCTMFALFLHNV